MATRINFSAIVHEHPLAFCDVLDLLTRAHARIEHDAEAMKILSDLPSPHLAVCFYFQSGVPSYHMIHVAVHRDKSVTCTINIRPQVLLRDEAAFIDALWLGFVHAIIAAHRKMKVHSEPLIQWIQLRMADRSYSA